MIKEIKRSRLPKDVLFLIDILDNSELVDIDEDSKHLYYKYESLFKIKTDVIIPYYFSIARLLFDKFGIDYNVSDYIKLMYENVIISIENSKYYNYKIQ